MTFGFKVGFGMSIYDFLLGIKIKQKRKYLI